MNFVEILEKCLIDEGIIKNPGKKELLPMQPGDVYQTYADVSDLERDLGFKPATPLSEGLSRFAKWYRSYFQSLKISELQNSQRIRNRQQSF